MHRAYHPTPHVRKRRIRWWAVLPWLVAAYLATGVYSVGPNERAVVRRCGRPLESVRMPGLHFGFPCGIDRVTRLSLCVDGAPNGRTGGNGKVEEATI